MPTRCVLRWARSATAVLRVLFVCERDYLPASHGELLYQTANASWLQPHDDPRVQRMAECYLQVKRTARANLLPADQIAKAASASAQQSAAAE